MDDSGVPSAPDGRRSGGQPGSTLALIGFLCSLASPGLVVLFFVVGDVLADVSWGEFVVLAFLLGVLFAALCALVMSLVSVLAERARGIARVMAIAGAVLATAELTGIVWLAILFRHGTALG